MKSVLFLTRFGLLITKTVSVLLEQIITIFKMKKWRKTASNTQFLSSSEPDYNYCSIHFSQPNPDFKVHITMARDRRKCKHDPDVSAASVGVLYHKQKQKMTGFVEKSLYIYVYVKFFDIKWSTWTYFSTSDCKWNDTCWTLNFIIQSETFWH